MSMYLFDEQPIVANKALARALGLNEALVFKPIFPRFVTRDGAISSSKTA